MSTAAEAAKNVIRVHETIKPVEDEFLGIFRNYTKTVKEFCRNRSWHSSEVFYCLLDNRWFNINDIDFVSGAEENEIIINAIDPFTDPFGENWVSISYDELDNPTPYLEAAYEKYAAARSELEKDWKEARRKKLEKELAELSD